MAAGGQCDSWRRDDVIKCVGAGNPRLSFQRVAEVKGAESDYDYDYVDGDDDDGSDDDDDDDDNEKGESSRAAPDCSCL